LGQLRGCWVGCLGPQLEGQQEGNGVNCMDDTNNTGPTGTKMEGTANWLSGLAHSCRSRLQTTKQTCPAGFSTTNLQPPNTLFACLHCKSIPNGDWMDTSILILGNDGRRCAA